jgi:uncharacterized protein (TIGR01777 family)
MEKHILITGASGLVGTRLTNLLLAKGHDVSHLGRSKKPGKVKTYVWDIEKFAIEPGALQGVDTIIHLAGAGVAEKRWTKNRKTEILTSRTKSSELLYSELKKGTHTVTAVVSASAIGYYGFDDNETLLTELSAPGDDFLAQVTKKWEDEVDQINSLGIRVVKLRIGIVLSDKGGALKQMAAPVKMFAGAPLGTGKQNLSWIHLDDLCAMFIKAAEDGQLKGAYNATGPYAVTNKEMTTAIAKVLDKPLLFPPVPAFVLKVVLGEMADIVVNGSSVSSEKIQKTGFVFQFNSLERALENLLKSN